MIEMVEGLVILNTVLSLVLLYLVVPLSRLQGEFGMLRTVISSHEQRLQALEVA